MKLSKGIGEIQKKELQFIWQAPDIYSEVHDNNVWLIYGRKGSGKSTLIEYLGSDHLDARVIIIRPRHSNLFQKVLVAIKDVKDEDRIIEESIAVTVEFILITRIMRELVKGKSSFLPGGNLETIYNFLVQHSLDKGSVLRKAISLISKTSGKLALVPDIEQILNTAEGKVDYDEAKDALIEYSKELNKGVVLCIDDIDQIGFSFSRYDRLFVNGLLILMGRNNVNFLENGAKVRIVLTIPSELYFHSTMWGSDWISGKSECLNWDEPEDIKQLVNKRIAMELNVRKHQKKHSSDIYSIDVAKTWNRVLPVQIRNKMGKTESAFEYLLRHTFYTPRHVLGVCDKVMSCVDKQTESNENIEDVSKEFSEHQWNDLFRKAVREFSEEAEKEFRDLFDNIYDGLSAVLASFKSRPYVWNRSQLLRHIDRSSLSLIRRDKERTYNEESLVYILHRIGFLGLGVRRVSESPTGSQGYEVKFSFLERHPYKGGWEIAVISPLFYDTYDIRPINKMIIKPHEDLMLSNKVLQKIMTYDVETNNTLTMR
ncbi:MAG: hypothetical protein JAZ17_20760 [Candidatus Thiodiazotropha endolucinida]|nr:hypothetical protein [Candidatus Thiodiazotropha endolucinida]